ncbi:ABC transporter ATP-binding protein [Actinomadura madurae]|uniref:ABC transporter ATP-binding protein n=1 Tax=Actinomadura madurae TaxID=1993 RepID=UPI002025B5FA|nr:ABC transporter ATP-binding protein [Actinomadura madurae]MCP9951450.1 ABC transporter ATP-binding protein [Actinomadura madurae]MCP9968225.1 ABC transporter ATP-binding protein [Actinomadura madurae]MCP9980683.1 ABC transporter ATP-binding protein [Actinomadura madurae]MCQ0007808.1 ABC transporter ATP-binding protein [Actinomadura madurae]MCQ0016882.1 ABC transporter ATP-binding protein [Actinomadura madurae]
MLEVVDLRKTYGHGADAVPAIGGLSFRVEKKEFVCVVGPSGCGKTTTLKCLSGLLRATAGEVRLLGESVDAPPPEMALVFQDYGRSLFPWLTVRGNVELPLLSKGIGRAERGRLVGEALDAVGLGDALERYPWQLSGGMQQRAAIARALAYQPEILLLDEPFASVDAQTRADLEDLVLRVRQEFGVTVLLVTHDIDEAVYLADRVVVLTPAPTRVREIVTVPLSRPRDQVGTKGHPEFARLRTQVYQMINSGDDVAPASLAG